MNRLGLAICLTALLAGSAGSVAGPEKAMAPLKEQRVNVATSWSMTTSFKSGERACVIVIGQPNEESHLGLYVFDGNGNCVARDDDTGGKFLNDRAVIWYPAKAQKYTIEVRNLGLVNDSFYIAIR